MSAGVCNLDANLIIEQGSVYSLLVTFTALDLSGYTFAASIRRNVADVTNNARLVDFTVASTDLLHGIVTLSLTAVQTQALTWDSTYGGADKGDRRFRLGRWDFEMTSATGVMSREIEGDAWLSREVTRA